MQACGLILGSHPYDVLGMPQTHPVLVCCTHRVLGMPWEVTLTNDMQQRPIYELSFSAYLRLLPSVLQVYLIILVHNSSHTALSSLDPREGVVEPKRTATRS